MQNSIIAINNFLPPFLTVEISNICNIKCKMCTLREKDPLSPQFMNIPTFSKILDSIYKSPLRFSDLRLFWTGEPLLNPDFNTFLKMLYDREKKYKKFSLIAFDTNGILFNDSIISTIEFVSEILPLSIIVSLDSINTETYSKIRGRNSEIVIENIKKLLKIKKNYPKVAVQFIIMRENYNEIKEFITYWENEFKKHSKDFNILLNASTAEKNGVNLRPLTEQNNPSMQDESNNLYINTLKNIGIFVDENIISSQGGGHYEG